MSLGVGNLNREKVGACLIVVDIGHNNGKPILKKMANKMETAATLC